MTTPTFPTIKGMDMALHREPFYVTHTGASAGRQEYRTTYDSLPRYRYSLSMNFLRENLNSNEAATLWDFFEARKGPLERFLFNDPFDTPTLRWVRFDMESLPLEIIAAGTAASGGQTWDSRAIKMVSLRDPVGLTTVIITTPPADSSYLPNTDITYTAVAHCTLPELDGPYTYYWTFDDGGAPQTGATITKSWADVGYHVATVVATNTADGETPSANRRIRIALPAVATTYFRSRARAFYSPAQKAAFIFQGETTDADYGMHILKLADGDNAVTVAYTMTHGAGDGQQPHRAAWSHEAMACQVGEYIYLAGSSSFGVSTKRWAIYNMGTNTLAQYNYVSDYSISHTNVTYCGAYVLLGPGTPVELEAGYCLVLYPDGSSALGAPAYFVSFTGSTNGLTTVDGTIRYYSHTNFGELGSAVPIVAADGHLNWTAIYYDGMDGLDLKGERITYAQTGLGLQCGGLRDSVPTAQCRVAGTIYDGPAMAAARTSFALVRIDDHRMVAIGGCTGGTNATAVNTGEICTVSDTGSYWGNVTNTMSVKRFAPACCAMGSGNILIYGGMDENSNYLDTFEFYHPLTNRFESFD